MIEGASIVWLKGPLTVGLAFGVNDVLKGGLSPKAFRVFREKIWGMRFLDLGLGPSDLSVGGFTSRECL